MGHKFASQEKLSFDLIIVLRIKLTINKLIESVFLNMFLQCIFKHVPTMYF